MPHTAAGSAGLAPAAGRGEHCWPADVAIIAIAGPQVALSARHRVQPAWMAPAVLLRY